MRYCRLTGGGRAFDEAELRAAFGRANPRWVWMVACETSTGVRNALNLPRALCGDIGADLCVDAVSALGLQALDLTGARFASAVSGKALGAYSGLAIVAHNDRLVPAGLVPRYLDLAAYRDASGVPFTQSSNLLAALDVALAANWERRWRLVRDTDQWLRSSLLQRGFDLVADPHHAMPGVLSLALPPHVPSARLARRMERSGYLLGHRSEYLARRNWVQICLMGDWDRRALEILPDVLAHHAKALAAAPFSVEACP